MERVKQFYNKNQFVIESNERVTFQSYQSTCATIDNTGQHLTLGKDWNYSNTTRKHLYLFIDAYCYNISILKALDETNKQKAIQKLIDSGIIKYDETL